MHADRLELVGVEEMSLVNDDGHVPAAFAGLGGQRRGGRGTSANPVEAGVTPRAATTALPAPYRFG
jgi:hypothetical protein